MVEEVGYKGGHGQEGRHQNYLFYANDVMIESSEPKFLQGSLSTLVGMF